MDSHPIYVVCLIVPQSRSVQADCPQSIFRLLPATSAVLRTQLQMLAKKLPDDEHLRSVVESTIRSFISVRVMNATSYQILLPRFLPDSDTIVRVLNAAFALRHFRSDRAKYPSEILHQHKEERSGGTP